MQSALQVINKVKIHFLIKKKVSFGFAVYVAGSTHPLGLWKIESSLRLNWNQEDYWSGFVEVDAVIGQVLKIQFKYLVAWYDQPLYGPLEWQEGQFNRQLLLLGTEDNIIIESVWGANKICLNLLVPKLIIKNDTQIYLAGGCNQLGNWKSRLKMNKNCFENLSQQLLIKAKQSIIIQDYEVYSVTLSVQRNLNSFSYYFLKKNGNQWIPDRVPQRQFKIDQANNQVSSYIHASSKYGSYDLLELSKFVELYYSKITDNIYIGGNIETCDDVKQLKKKGITAILYLASPEVLSTKHALLNLIKLISQQNKIQFSSIKIDLAHSQRLMEEAIQALNQLMVFLQSQQKIVYVYCNTGTLLAPLLVALYLYKLGDISLIRALQYVKQKHPISAINQNIMSVAQQIAGRSSLNRQQQNIGRRRFGNIRVDQH